MDVDLKDPAFYQHWTEADLEAHVKCLREILAKKQGYVPLPTKQALMEFLDPEGANFLNSGMSAQDFMVAHRVRDIQNLFVCQERPERRRRMGLIVEMAAELKVIRSQTRFGTMSAEGVIEDVIRGDWASVRTIGESFSFEDEHEDLRTRYAPIFKHFRELCRQAFDGRPGAADVTDAPKN